MSRVIKFRVFNTERNSMMSGVNQYGYDEPDTEIRTTSSGAFTRLWESLARIEEDANFHIMQFTGLTDKNGVDIYEGDILSHEINCAYDAGRVNEEVSYQGCGFTSGDGCLQIIVDAFRPEVIGNVHQHPELLK